MPLELQTLTTADPSSAGIEQTQNTNKISGSEQPCTKLGAMVKSGTDTIRTLLSDATSGVKNRSVESRLDRFLDKCAKFFQRIGSLLNLCDSPEIQAARKNAKAIKLETEGLLRCFRNENTEIEGQVQLLQSHLKDNGKRLGTTETLILKNKIAENGEVIDMCETRIDELQAKLKKTTDVDCQLHLMQAAKNLAKLATETYRLSLEIMKLLSRAGAPNIPNIRNVPDPDASAPTTAEKPVGTQPKDATNIPQPPARGERQASFETIRSAFKSTSEKVAKEPDIKRNPETDASPSRPNPEPSGHGKAKKVPQQPKGQGNTAPFGTFQFRQKRNVAAHKTSSLDPIPEEEIRNPNPPSSGSKKPSVQKIGKRNRITFKETEKTEEEQKPSAIEKRKAYSKNVVDKKYKDMKTDNKFDAQNQIFVPNGVHRNADDSKHKPYNTHDESQQS